MAKCFLYIIISLFFTGVFCSCNENKTYQPSTIETAQKDSSENINIRIKRAAALLQNGDLITRSDDDLQSLALQNFSDSDRSYSHSGIAYKEGDGFVVYHSMTGNENPSGLLKRDPFDSFVSPEYKTGFGIFRYQLSDKEKEKFHHILISNFEKKVPFDVDFNLKTDDSLYCSEMIAKGLLTATDGRIHIPHTTINNFTPKLIGHTFKQKHYKSFEYIAIDNLYLNPFCKEITRVKY